MPKRSNRAVVAALWTAVAATGSAGILGRTSQENGVTPSASRGDARDAICPIVYQADETPSTAGYQYIFYGNAFFINEQGYLLTAAHVLRSFGDGAQVYVLVSRAEAPPRLVKASLVAADWAHDVAVLRATSNPFADKSRVGYLRLATGMPERGEPVFVEALRPVKTFPRSFEAPQEDRVNAEVVAYQFEELEKGRDATKLFLFNHEVILGQSGAPVLKEGTNDVAGLVEGRWLRPAASLVQATKDVAGGGGTGAAVPMHYAIALLEREGIAWHAGSSSPLDPAGAPGDNTAGSVPAPLSLLAPPYPSESLFEGEVLLDALVRRNGTLADIRIIAGKPPFTDKALGTVRTWIFLPGRVAGNAAESRIGIAVEFVQTPASGEARRERVIGARLDVVERGATPAVTLAPQYPAGNAGEGSVVLYERIDSAGRVNATQVLSDAGGFARAATEAVRQWRFVPGRHRGTNAESAAVIAVIFRNLSAGGPQAPSPASQATH